MLRGKRGVIFGVANERSIAWGCAKVCAEMGATLAFTYLGEPQKKRITRLLNTELPNAPIFPCDVSKDEDIKNLFSQLREQWDSLDFIIHSVAFAQKEDLGGLFLHTSRTSFLLALDISVYSFVSIAREAVPLMQNGGALLTMSYYGAEKVVPQYNVMGVAKAALEATVRYLAYDLGPQKIRVNCISAGPIRTLSASIIPGMKVMLDTIEKWAPLRRNITQDDIAKTAVFLISDLASGITGEVVHVDSGYNILGFSSLQEPPDNLTIGNSTDAAS